ncbi:MAG TPA: hypothetical protein ENN09_02245 [Planctomycetes bacterium]|nr:hypothetical protein [Planctomycetota bacterium]
MKRINSRIVVIAAAGLLALSGGCSTNVSAAYWMPSFENQTKSGAGGDTVDVKADFGVEADEGVLLFELAGSTGAHRFTANYWKIEGAGSKVMTADRDFADHTYAIGDQTRTSLDFTCIGALWEPALVNRPTFAFRLLIGANLINFNMAAENITNPAPPGDGETHVPADDSTFADIGYMPVPVAGASIDFPINRWLYFSARGQYFDTELIGGGLDFEASFTSAEAALLFGKPGNHVQGFAGYRYLRIKYDADDDAGDSTLDGVIAGAAFIF